MNRSDTAISVAQRIERILIRMEKEQLKARATVDLLKRPEPPKPTDASDGPPLLGRYQLAVGAFLVGVWSALVVVWLLTQ